MEIRRALPSEAAALSALALRSKALWGYSPDFLEACRENLTLTEDEIAGTPVFVLVEDGRLLGFYGLAVEGDRVELAYLFVEPSAARTGVGGRLWAHALASARSLGCNELWIQSDPNAEGFYLHMGARRTGESESTVLAGRMLPLLVYPLQET